MEDLAVLLVVLLPVFYYLCLAVIIRDYVRRQDRRLRD